MIVVLLSLLVRHQVLVLLSCNPEFLGQEDVPNHSWNMSVVEMAGTAPCLENQSVEKAHKLSNVCIDTCLPKGANANRFVEGEGKGANVTGW